MSALMTARSRRELVEALRQRYAAATREENQDSVWRLNSFKIDAFIAKNESTSVH